MTNAPGIKRTLLHNPRFSKEGHMDGFNVLSLCGLFAVNAVIGSNGIDSVLFEIEKTITNKMSRCNDSRCSTDLARKSQMN